MNIPKAIFTGVEGSRFCEASQRQKNSSGNVSATTQNGLIALEMMPDTFQSVFSWAQYVSVELYWRKAIQKMITTPNTISSAPIRIQSGTASIARGGGTEAEAGEPSGAGPDGAGAADCGADAGDAPPST